MAQKILMAVILAVGISAPAFADVEYVGGKVYQSGTYDGPAMTGRDVAVLATVATLYALPGMGLPQAAEIAGQGIATASFLTWGAVRTAQYRPESVKAEVRSGMAAKAAQPQPGTVREVLGL